MSTTRTSARLVLLATALTGLAACEQEVRSAQWYMGHGAQMEAKVKECNADPRRKETDQDCKNAIEAFVTLVQATEKQPPVGQP